MPAVTGVISIVVSTIGSIIGSVISSIVSIISSIVSFVAAQVATITSFIATIIASIVSNIISITWAVISNLTNIISQGIAFIAAKVTSGVKWIISNIISSASKVASVFARLAVDAASPVYKAIAALARFVQAAVTGLGNAIKFVADSVYRTISGLVEWVKKTYDAIKAWVEKTIQPIQEIINNRVMKIIEFYEKNIEPYANRLVDLIHKASTVSELVVSIKQKKPLIALLKGIAIVSPELKEKVVQIIKNYDGTLKSFAKAIGVISGKLHMMILDATNKTRIIAEDIQKIARALGIKELEKIGIRIEEISKKVYMRTTLRIRGVERTIREWITYLTQPAIEAMRILEMTYRDYRKYEYLLRAAELRHFNALHAKAWMPLMYPPILRRR